MERRHVSRDGPSRARIESASARSGSCAAGQDSSDPRDDWRVSEWLSVVGSDFDRLGQLRQLLAAPPRPDVVSLSVWRSATSYLSVRDARGGRRPSMDGMEESQEWVWLLSSCGVRVENPLLKAKHSVATTATTAVESGCLYPPPSLLRDRLRRVSTVGRFPSFPLLRQFQVPSLVYYGSVNCFNSIPQSDTT